MGCHMMGTSTHGLLSGQCGSKHVSWSLWPNRSSSPANIQLFQYNLVPWCLRKDFRKFSYINQDYCMSRGIRYSHWRLLCLPTTLEEELSSPQSKNYSKGDEYGSEASSEDILEKPISNDQLKSLLADHERAKLLRKLSEANQHNRYLKRQGWVPMRRRVNVRSVRRDLYPWMHIRIRCTKIRCTTMHRINPRMKRNFWVGLRLKLLVREESFTQFKSELAITELEIQALLNMAKEIVSYGIPAGSRKINGKYIQSLLLLQLQGIQEKLKKQIKDVELAQSKEVSLFWSGMAESVQVMGSFDGWSHGEYLSAEYTGSYTRFSTSIMLRPGRYEIKFLVDGEWLLSPDYPTVGEGLLENNLLIVE